MLKIKDITLSYDFFTLGPINIELEKGKLYSIIGKSGAGKSTLVKIISGAIKNYDGKLCYNDEQLTSDDLLYIPQQRMLFNHLTILENLELCNYKLDKLETIFASLGLCLSILTKYPFEISGGQAQRVDFARALFSEKKLILLDEVFGALDVNTKDEMYELVYKLSKDYPDTIILLITHDLEEAFALSDYIYLLDDGQISFEGTAKQFISTSSESVISLISEKRRKRLEVYYG